MAPERDLWPWNTEIILIGALAALVLYRILSRLRPGRPVLVAGVWASVAFSAPMAVTPVRYTLRCPPYCSR